MSATAVIHRRKALPELRRGRGDDGTRFTWCEVMAPRSQVREGHGAEPTCEACKAAYVRARLGE